MGDNGLILVARRLLSFSTPPFQTLSLVQQTKFSSAEPLEVRVGLCPAADAPVCPEITLWSCQGWSLDSVGLKMELPRPGVGGCAENSVTIEN